MHAPPEFQSDDKRAPVGPHKWYNCRAAAHQSFALMTGRALLRPRSSSPPRRKVRLARDRMMPAEGERQPRNALQCYTTHISHQSQRTTEVTSDGQANDASVRRKAASHSETVKLTQCPPPRTCVDAARPHVRPCGGLHLKNAHAAVYNDGVPHCHVLHEGIVRDGHRGDAVQRRRRGVADLRGGAKCS